MANNPISGTMNLCSLFNNLLVNNVRTVSDTKRDFYSHHTRPINSIYRRAVEELMVEMHLLSVNVNFRYDPVYALGVVSAFNKFMQGYQPERDKAAIFEALCHAVEDNPQKYQQDAQRLNELATRLSAKELISWFGSPTNVDGTGDLPDSIRAIANNPNFKYSRLFAIGLYTILELADADFVKDEKQRTQALKEICDTLHLPEDKLQKDLDLYRSNLEKMNQMRLVIEDTLNAERKKREKRAQEQGSGSTPA